MLHTLCRNEWRTLQIQKKERKFPEQTSREAVKEKACVHEAWQIECKSGIFYVISRHRQANPPGIPGLIQRVSDRNGGRHLKEQVCDRSDQILWNPVGWEQFTYWTRLFFFFYCTVLDGMTVQPKRESFFSSPKMFSHIWNYGKVIQVQLKRFILIFFYIYGGQKLTADERWFHSMNFEELLNDNREAFCDIVVIVTKKCHH